MFLKFQRAVARAARCSIRDVRLATLFLGLLLAACQTTVPDPTPLPAAELAQAQRDDRKLLQDIVVNRAALQRDFLKFYETRTWEDRGYFSAQESDQLELLMYRFHTLHHELSEMIARHHVGDGIQDDSAKRSFEIREKATTLQREQARYVVDTFAGDRVAIAKLNQRFPRSEIPRHTYDRLADSLMSSARRQVVQLSRKAEDEFDNSSYDLQAKVIMQVGKFKNPTAHLLHFSDEQKQEVIGLLEPGDILLTFTAGYASTVFIPGAFKHAMVYVGSVEERKAIGLKAGSQGGAAVLREVATNLDVDKTSDGRRANIIEAEFEGVKFSNLEHLMDTHMNRLAVLRPRLDTTERVQYLAQIFSYLGQDYDFRFDFADASRQVCTEIIYRALNGRSGIDFTLSRHTGHLTLSADDIIRYWMDKSPESFQFILFAHESPLKPGHAAQVLVGEDGEKKLRDLMRP